MKAPAFPPILVVPADGVPPFPEEKVNAPPEPPVVVVAFTDGEPPPGTEKVNDPELPPVDAVVALSARPAPPDVIATLPPFPPVPVVAIVVLPPAPLLSLNPPSVVAVVPEAVATSTGTCPSQSNPRTDPPEFAVLRPIPNVRLLRFNDNIIEGVPVLASVDHNWR